MGILPLALGLGAWQLFGDANSPYFPVPSSWASSLRPLASNGELWHAVLATARTFIIALVIAIVLGAVVGVLIGASRPTDRAVGPLVEFMRALPASTLVPLMTLILGYTTEMSLVVVVLATVWPVLLNCRSARRSMSPLLLDVPRTLGLTRWEGVAKVQLPALTPAILLGVRLAGPLALIITLLVEILTRIDGIGALLAEAQEDFRSAQVYAMLVIAGVMGLIINGIAVRLEVVVTRRIRGDAAS